MAQDRSDDAHDGPRLESAPPPDTALPPDSTQPDLDAQAAARAEPLPEEVAAGDVGDRRDEAAEILRDSEERIAEALQGDAPGDAADESRRSEETI